MTTYRIEKVDVNTEESVDYGIGYTMSDVKEMVKGYALDKELSDSFMMTFSRKNGKYLFFVTAQ